MEQKRKVVLMGNGMVTPAVAAHVKKTVSTAPKQATTPARQRQVVQMGNGMVTPAVAAHVRKSAG